MNALANSSYCNRRSQQNVDFERKNDCVNPRLKTGCCICQKSDTTARITDVAVLNGRNTKWQERAKTEKYWDLRLETQRLRKVRAESTNSKSRNKISEQEGYLTKLPRTYYRPSPELKQHSSEVPNSTVKHKISQNPARVPRPIFTA